MFLRNQVLVIITYITTITNTNTTIELLRQLHQIQQSFIEVSLKLQVAIKISEDDESTISFLRKEAADARIDALNAKKQAEEASNTIKDLKMEINILKKKLKDQPSHHSNNHSNSHESNHHHSNHNNHNNNTNNTNNTNTISNRNENDMANLAIQADKEVDNLMHNYDHMPGMSIALPGMTPFKTWKMQQYLASAEKEDDEDDTVNTEKVKKIATSSLKDFNEIRKKIAEVTINSNNITNNNANSNKKNVTILPNMNIKNSQAIV